MRRLPWRSIRTMVWKDLIVVLRSPMILLPMILLPIILQVLLPVGLGLAVIYAPESLQSDPDLQRLLAAMPQGLMAEYGHLPQEGQLLALMLVYLFAPLFLIIPMMVASVTAADSFVGERERKTIEALLHTPLSDGELLLAKLLAPWLAAQAVSMLSFIIYSVAVNAVSYPIMGQVFFPNLLWLILVLWVVPAAAGLGLGVTVLLSSRVRTFQEAYQAGGLVVVPIVGLLLAQVSGALFLSPALALVLGLVLWLLDGALLALGRRAFTREDLLARI